MSKDLSIEESIRQLELDTHSALRWAEQGKIEAWVHRNLLSGVGGRSNPQFSEGLKQAKRWWNGPLEIELAALSPAVGIDPGKEFVVNEDYWANRTGKMAEAFTNLLALPPLIVEYRTGALSVRDGNTRLGAMHRLGWSTCWVVIWYNTEKDYQNHSALL